MNRLIKLAIFIACYAVFHAFILRPYIAGGVCTSKAKMNGKTVIITGANTGLGKETALDLAGRGARVIMACRNLEKAEAAKKEIVGKTGSKNIIVKVLNLASFKSIREFADDVKKNEARLDVLINNAGIFYFTMPENPELLKTEDGFEMTMGVNHLGHFLLTNLLLDLLKKSAPSRVVVVSSVIHHDWLSTEFRDKPGLKFGIFTGEVIPSGYVSYGQSKLANIMFTRELARRLEGTGVTANSLHPGSVGTDLQRHFPAWIQSLMTVANTFLKTTKEGAQTQIHLAVSEEVEGVTGLYFTDCKEREPSKTAQDNNAAKKLWEVSAKLVGLDTSQ